MPAGSCLMIHDPHHPWQQRYMRQLRRLLRARGTRVRILAVAEAGGPAAT
jgi:hypothetical protein